MSLMQHPEILPHALPGMAAWLREQASADQDKAALQLLDLHKLVIASPAFHEPHAGYAGYREEWRVVNEDPDFNAMRLDIRPGRWEAHCRNCRKPWPCEAVRALAPAYRNRDGYENGWNL